MLQIIDALDKILNEKPTVTIPTVQLNLPDKDALQRLLLEIPTTINGNEDFYSNINMLLAVKVLTSMGQKALYLDDKLAFIMCVWNYHHTYLMKKIRIHISTLCKCYKSQNTNDKTYANQKIRNKQT